MQPSYSQQQDIVYGYRDRHALVFDAYAPRQNANGKAIVWVSAGGYTVDEIRTDIPRAVRCIRHRAPDFGIAPEAIGIFGGSSGGHISLMTAMAPPDPDLQA